MVGLCALPLTLCLSHAAQAQNGTTAYGQVVLSDPGLGGLYLNDQMINSGALLGNYGSSSIKIRLPRIAGGAQSAYTQPANGQNTKFRFRLPGPAPVGGVFQKRTISLLLEATAKAALVGPAISSVATASSVITVEGATVADVSVGPGADRDQAPAVQPRGHF